ncbi:MAG: hypothetical protein HN348_34640, partial [Proteobacteria bacterium]|nr:hypothetical protein [Pseudomonadota bacterium]
ANANTSGGLDSTSRWDEAESAVTIASAYDVKVHLCVTNFDSDELDTILSSSTIRNKLISELKDWQDQTGVDGINIDFEGLPSSVKQEMVTFTEDLADEVGEVVLATPAVDWNGSWDFDELAKHAHMFIMGYAYHYSGSSQAGPNDPLYGGDPWSKYALDWSVEDYTNPSYGAPADKIILGLPLYGFRWSVSSNTIPATATSTGSSIFYAEALAEAQTHGELWESNSETPYWYDGSRQGWYSNEESIELRIQYAQSESLGGIGFWALHYDDGDSDLWNMIHEETTDEVIDPGDDDDDDDGPVYSDDYQADAGQPFLAYVGDTIMLSGEGSLGPDGIEIHYEWTQIEGPEATLTDADSATPTFVIETAGVTVFELMVGNGEVFSQPDRSHVVVLDPDAGRRHRGSCSCNFG